MDPRHDMDEYRSMDLSMRRIRPGDAEEVVALSLRAWEPVFASFERVLGPRVYALLYPDWRASQGRGVADICSEPAGTSVWVAERAGRVVGFVAYELRPAEGVGEVQLLAVDPAHQNVGVGTALSDLALAQMREAGMRLAVVGTGGDAGHAPARRTYEKSGYVGLPLVRYYRDL